jgi:hypothetical protein
MCAESVFSHQLLRDLSREAGLDAALDIDLRQLLALEGDVPRSGIVAVVTILARQTLGQALAQRLPQLERSARVLQGAAGVAIIAIAVLTLSQLRL